MAESAVTFFLENLSNLVTQEGRFLLGVEDQIRLLRYELQWIRSFLRDADAKRKKYETVKVWVTQIREVAYDAEDAIEMFLLKVEQHPLSSIRFMGPIGRYLGCITQIPTIHRLGNQIDEINTRLERISNNKSKYGIDDIQAEEYSSSSSNEVGWKHYRAHIAEDVDVIGFQKEEEELAKQLLNHGDHQFGVVSIVGMGGLGKTTLAKKLYNRSDVKNHFDCCVWVSVSQEFRIINLLLSIIEQVMGLSEELYKETEEKLHEKLIYCLKKRSYLLILDDVWKKEAWDRLKEALMVVPMEGKQSRVLLTTRNEEVAKHANPSIYHHNLRLLDERESWDLFEKVVFRAGSTETNFPDNLKSLGKQIVDKCGGLPLAIVVLGGLLSTKEKTPTVWIKVVESANWQLIHDSKQPLQVLAMSYNDLPYYLKSCFLYFGLFPEDEEINASQIIHLWVAEGFIEERDNEMMEDVGEDYLEELIQRSMIQAERRRHDGGVLSIRIHDLLREMAISEAKKDNFLDIHGNYNKVSPNIPRRLAIHGYSANSSFGKSDLNHLRSMLCFPGRGRIEQNLNNLSKCVKLLRVLELQNANIETLPSEIGKLIFLKYLGLEGTSMQSLPHSVGNLRNLQTLNLWRSSMYYIPSAIWKLHRLRHLKINYPWRSSDLIVDIDCDIAEGRCFVVKGTIHCCCLPPPQIHQLSDLQTLNLAAGSWIEGGLHKLTNLRELNISGKLSKYKETLSNSISKFHRLRVLSLSENYAVLPLVSFSHHVHLFSLTLGGRLEKLLVPDAAFPPNLNELILWDSELKQEDSPMATLGKLQNLKILRLGFRSFVGTEMTCSAGSFPKLLELQLNYLPSLEVWNVEEGAMINLKDLDINQCERLKMLPDGLKHISTLVKLRLTNMPREFSNRVQESEGED